MIIYQATKAQFLDDAFKRDIQDVVLLPYRDRTGRSVGRPELESWRNSLTQMAKVVNDDEIPDDAGVAIEYHIPQTSKRVDFILTGESHDHKPYVIIVELKQWSEAQLNARDAMVTTWLSGRQRDVVHPSYQAYSYAALLTSFNEAVYSGDVTLKPCAYLHNYLPNGVINHESYAHYLEKAPAFLSGEIERKRLQDFIKRFVKYGDSGEMLYRIENGRIRPSKMLADSVVGLIRGNEEFVLIDDQKVVFETARTMARQATTKRKKVLIVEGGPGTGKSVVAVNLLAALTNDRLVARYVSKNAAPRSVYEAKLTGVIRKTEISNLFSGSGSFINSDPNSFDALVVDEAHRLDERSGLYRNRGENQIKEIISAAKCTIFFIDEDQRVRLTEIGRVKEIEEWADSFDADVEYAELESQFRCNGSDGYLAWLDNTLQIRDTANDVFDTEAFDFRVLDTPGEVRNLIVERNKVNNKSRMVAGFCWDWPSKKDPTAMDVVIREHHFAMQWNLGSDGSLWIIAPDSVEQIGCIHTCQGLEVDYIGVIVGPDLIVRDNVVLTSAESHPARDWNVRGWKKSSESDPEGTRARIDTIIKNTYRTLLTRGMKGCYVYFTDKEAAAYFKSRLSRVDTSQTSPAPETPRRVPLRLLEPEAARPYMNSVPLVDLKVAAGAFGPSQGSDPSDFEWVELPDHLRPREDLFVAQVVGESMNRRIPNGSWCLFRLNPTGTRNGRVVIAEHRDIHDPELGGSYTVKVYRSVKETNESGWMHSRVILQPDSFETGFKDIVVDQDSEGDLRIVAELVEVLE